jgi:hypothetical protein
MPFEYSFMSRETCSGDVSSFDKAGFFSSAVAGRPSDVLVRDASKVGSALMLEGTLSGLTCRCLCIYVCHCGSDGSQRVKSAQSLVTVSYYVRCEQPAEQLY